jgi:hypothetical protein
MVWAHDDNYSINHLLSSLMTINDYHFMDKIQYSTWTENHFDLWNGQLKIQCEVFTRENILGWGLKVKSCRARKRSWKEGEGSWCCALRIAFSKRLPCLPPSTAVNFKLKDEQHHLLHTETNKVFCKRLTNTSTNLEQYPIIFKFYVNNT